MTRLLLLRHGESEWNVQGRWQGHADPPLTEFGERQSAVAALVIEGVARVVASDLRRARRTAEIIATTAGLGMVCLWAPLRERDVGQWSGRTNDEVDAAFPDFRAEGRTPLGWEPDQHLLERILPALVAIASMPIDALVVTHGGVIRLLEEHLGGAPPSTVANLEGRWLEVEEDGISLGERVRLLEE